MRSYLQRELEGRVHIPDMTGRSFSFSDIVYSSMGENKEQPRAGELIILLDSCSMGQTIRSDKRVHATGPAFSQRELYGPQADNIYIVRTDDGKNVILADLRRLKGRSGAWVYVR